MTSIDSIEGPHQGAQVYTRDAKNPDQAMILVHGRGASFESILPLTDVASETALVLSPQANNFTWYPERFLVSQQANEPHLTSALDLLSAVIDLARARGLTESEITLVGFSQGACLVAEYIKRQPTKYKGVLILSGGLIGTDDEVEQDCAGDLASTPIYIGCDESDPHIPLARVQATTEYFQNHSAIVTEKIYQDLGHTVHPDAQDFLKRI